MNFCLNIVDVEKDEKFKLSFEKQNNLESESLIG